MARLSLPRDVKALKAGDIIAVSGRRTILVEVLEAPGSGLREVDDRELLEVPSDVVDVVVTNKTFDGRTLADIGRDEVSRGIFLRRITRGGTDLGMLPDTRVNRGDVLTVVGSAAHTARVAEALGVADRPSDVTDMAVVATGIVAGALIGLPALEIGGVEIGLSLPVGVLLGGLVCGWLRSVRPGLFGRVPGPTLWIFESIGLTGFVAVVGLNAGPDFVQGLKASGLSLVVSRGDHDHGSAADRRDDRQVAVQDAPRRAARCMCWRLYRDAGAGRGAGGGAQFGTVDRIRSGLRRGQRAAGHLGHRDRRAAGLTRPPSRLQASCQIPPPQRYCHATPSRS